MTATDTDLIQYCQDHDAATEQAWEQLIQRHQSFVFRVAMAKTRNREDAWDAVQETFLAAYQFIHRFRADASLRHWLKRIAENKCSDLRRRKACRPAASLDALADLDAIADVSPHAGGTETAPGAAADRAMLLRDLERSISSLTAPLRVVATLRYMSDMSYEDICVELELSMGTVKSRLHRARLKLQRSGVVDRLADHHEWAGYRRAG